MKSQNVEQFLEEAGVHDGKLQEVFTKMSDIWQQHTGIRRKLSSSDVIETVLPDHVPINIGGYTYNEDDGDSLVAEVLARRLESELRAAKSQHLECGEVLLPCDLLTKVAKYIMRMADSEPCGLRGCNILMKFQNPEMCRDIGSINYDPDTVSTFELYLTLKQDASSWHSFLPQFLKNLTGGGTIVISSGFTIEKKKLYRSSQEH